MRSFRKFKLIIVIDFSMRFFAFGLFDRRFQTREKHIAFYFIFPSLQMIEINDMNMKISEKQNQHFAKQKSPRF